MRILFLLAGTNTPSNSTVLAAAFQKGIQETQPDAEIETIRVADLKLDHFTLAHYDPKTDQGKDYEDLKREVLKADGVVIATPIWNFSIPAHLKNLIDRMGTFGLDEETRSRGTLGGKPFFFLYTGGAPVPAWKGLMRFTTMHLPESIRYFGGSLFGRHFEGKCMVGRGKFGMVLDQRTAHLAKVARKGSRFAHRVARFAYDGTLPLSTIIVTKFYKLGQKILAKL